MEIFPNLMNFLKNFALLWRDISRDYLKKKNQKNNQHNNNNNNKIYHHRIRKKEFKS